MHHMGDLGQGASVEAVRTVTVRRVAVGDFRGWSAGFQAGLTPKYVATFARLQDIRPEGFDAVVPLQLDHYDALARWPHLRGRKFFHPSPEAVSLCDDKLALARFLVAEGFADHVPPSRSPGPPYPYVWKRRSGFWGLHCHIVTGPADEARLDLTDEAWFAQDYVGGEIEHATHVLLAGGQVRYASTFTYEMAGPGIVKGADQTPRVTWFHRGADHLDLFAAILSRIGYEGVACLDYRMVNGRPVLFEINPRFGSSLLADSSAYLDAYLGALAPT
jgi:hypothetical protein